MTFTTPETRISGLLMGDRILNYAGTLVIKDFTNKIESVTSFPFKESGKIEKLKGALTSIFSKADEIPLDHFIIQISQLNKETKTKDLVSEGHGTWLGQVYVEGKK
jgi:hypothetical protein